MNEYVSTKAARQILGITAQTLRNWDITGKIKTVKSASGIRLYNKSDIEAIVGGPVLAPEKQKERIVYCRVSSKKQLDDLKRQEDFFRHTFPDYTIVSDIASGINWKRKGFKAILDKAMRGNISELVVAHRDRLCRFAFELVEYILKQNNVKLTVLDRESNESSNSELADDIISIVHIYSCREMGRRRYKTKEKEETGQEEEQESSNVCEEI